MTSEWYKAENLMEIQNERKKEYNAGNIDEQNDFDSYRLLYEGKESKSGIELHNSTGYSAKTVALCLKKYYRLKQNVMRIADFGGGAGFIANEVSKLFPWADIYSYDIGEYATQYGREHFPNVTFINKAISENDIFKEGKFDVILAYEFYPFTRTTEWDYQQKYIKMCLHNLNKGGYLIIGLPNEGDNLLTHNELKLRQNFESQYMGKKSMPYVRIFSKVKVFNVAVVLSKILGLVKKRKQLLICLKA